MADLDTDLVFVPLGGAGEIGMNLNLYGLGSGDDRDWLMVDLGITFGDGSQPGVDVILPDPVFIEERKDRLVGLILTHAHEDHLGAVPYLWDRLQCPVYASPFTASVLRRKLREVGLENRVPLHVVPLSGSFSVGPFDLEMVSLTHSIPEPSAIAIRTPAGCVLHTGDWKLDPDPVIGEVAETNVLRQLGDDGVQALVCDSTNVFMEGTSGSEADLLASLTEIIRDCPNRVAVTCFASNVARVETIAQAAEATGRSVVAAGRSIKRIEEAARENGYLQDMRPLLDESQAADLPRDKVLILCTGSQGEPRAALARIAFGAHPRIALEADDTVIFSSKVIPGNERSIARIQNALIRGGINVISEDTHFVHVSGHPGREEMETMYRLVRPRISVPVHGETRHMVAHAELARRCDAKEVVLAENGTMVHLGPGKARLVDDVSVGRLALEGNRVVPIDGETVRSRTRAVYNGSVIVTIVMDGWGELVADPQFATIGLMEADEEAILHGASDAVWSALDPLSKGMLKDDDIVKETIRVAVRRYFRAELGKKPVTEVHFVRV